MFESILKTLGSIFLAIIIVLLIFGNFKITINNKYYEFNGIANKIKNDNKK